MGRPFYKKFLTLSAVWTIVLFTAFGRLIFGQHPLGNEFAVIEGALIFALALLLGFFTALQLSIARWELGLIPTVMQWIGNALAGLDIPKDR